MIKALRNAILASVLLCSASTGAFAEDWKLATVGAPGSALLGMGEKVAAAMTAATGGELNVTIQSIQNEQEMVQQVIRGRLQIGSTSAQGLGASVPDGTVLAFPLLWDSPEERNWVMENHVKPVLSGMLEEKGLHLLTIADAGYYGVFCKFECEDPDTLKGVKVRVSATAAAKLFWTEVGANPVQLPLSEFWPGLEQNLVRAGDIPFPFYLTTPARQSAPYYINTNHFHAPWIFFVNKELWDKLTPEMQQKVTDGLPPVDELLAMYSDEMQRGIADFEATGGHYYTPSAELMTKWRGNVAAKIPDLLKDMGPGAQTLYDAILAGKAEYAKQPK